MSIQINSLSHYRTHVTKKITCAPTPVRCATWWTTKTRPSPASSVTASWRVQALYLEIQLCAIQPISLQQFTYYNKILTSDSLESKMEGAHDQVFHSSHSSTYNIYEIKCKCTYHIQIWIYAVLRQQLLL